MSNSNMSNTNSNTIIAFIGKIGCGKTFACDLIKSNYSNVKDVIFAETLKKIAVDFGFPHKHVYGNASDKLKICEKWGVSSRAFMEQVGTNIFRNLLPKYIPEMEFVWVRNTERKILKCLKKSEIIVIGDCRFDDELEMLKRVCEETKTRLITIGITNGVEDSKFDSTHISNNAFAKWDLDNKIVNNMDCKFAEDICKIVGNSNTSKVKSQNINIKANKKANIDLINNICNNFGFDNSDEKNPFWKTNRSKFYKTLYILFNTELPLIFPQFKNCIEKIQYQRQYPETNIFIIMYLFLVCLIMFLSCKN